MKRTGKFYRDNERKLMLNYGLKPTANSGAGWIEKEDGENEKIIAQLKSTDAESIKINLLDVKKLFYHANVTHKTGLFIIQFLSSNEELLLMRPQDLQNIADGLRDSCSINNIAVVNNVSEVKYDAKMKHTEKQQKIKSGSKKARNNFYKQREENFNAKNKR